MYFERFIALRYLRDGRMQTLLILAGVAVGVAVIVFLSALINGLQTTLIKQTLGSQAHIVVRNPREEPLALPGPRGVHLLDRKERAAQRLRSIADWPQVLAVLSRFPGVTAATPTVAGSAFAKRGSSSKSVALRGVDPTTFSQIIQIEQKMRAGQFRVAGSDVVIGIELADELGMGVGDKLRLATAENPEGEVLTVSGLFDLGNKDVNQRWVLVSLRQAQTLLDLPGGASTLELRVSDIFAADAVATEAARQTGLVAESWMRLNAQLMIGLRSQNSSKVMIQVFVIIAVALGIASVLVVSVVQKSKEIGILKAVGTPTGRIVRLFLLQGGLLGLGGSLLGCLLGAGLSLFFAQMATAPDGSPLFPVELTPSLFAAATLIATGTGLIAAVAPARRAARLDPAQVIRHG